jgi:hypothetical protein
MSKPLAFLVIHCTDTPAGREVTSGDIRHWHTDPPPRGRGWSQVGYSDMIHLDGWLENLVPFDQDNLVDPEEITNGAVGYNANSHHIVYVGGCDINMFPMDTRTTQQSDTLLTCIKHMIDRYPDVKVCGHTDLNPGKACPSFDVSKFCHENGIDPKNIYKP